MPTLPAAKTGRLPIARSIPPSRVAETQSSYGMTNREGNGELVLLPFLAEELGREHHDRAPTDDVVRRADRLEIGAWQEVKLR